MVQASVRVQPRGGVQQGRGGAPREGRAHCRLTVRYSDIFLKEQCSEKNFFGFPQNRILLRPFLPTLLNLGFVFEMQK